MGDPLSVPSSFRRQEESVLVADRPEPERTDSSIRLGMTRGGTSSAAESRLPMNAIELLVVSGGYAPRPVLRAVWLRVRVGGFVGLVGPSGAGKTSLLRAMLGA